MLTDLLQGLALFALGSIAASCVLFAIKLARADGLEYERNQHRTQSFKKAIRGEVPTVHDGSRDYRVSAGVAVDRRRNTWLEQGRLSEEAISAALRPAKV